MHRSALWGTALALSMVFAEPQALILGGRFSGTAANSRIDALSPTPGTIDGAAVTGTFRLAVPDDYFRSEAFYVALNPPHEAWYMVPSGAVALSFDTAGRHVEFGDPRYGIAASVGLEDSGSGQALTLGADFAYPYWNAFLTLAGPANGFFDGLDLAAVHPGPVNAAGASAGFFAGRDFGASVVIDRISVDGHSVPEPSAWEMILAGWGGLAGFRGGERFRQGRGRAGASLRSPRSAG